MNKEKELEYERETEKLKHEWKLQEMEFEKKCKIAVEKIKHEFELETQRIKNADISRRLMQRE